MSLDQSFEQAQDKVQGLSTRPGNETLLKLYALYKQATIGDAKGFRPGIFDIKGRAKYDAWKALKGQDADQSKEAYVALVESLLAAD